MRVAEVVSFAEIAVKDGSQRLGDKPKTCPLPSGWCRAVRRHR